MNWYVDVISKYAVFDGRARRKEYWMFYLINIIISIVFNIILYASQQSTSIALIMLLYTLAIFLPSLGVSIRRLHDTGRSGWFVLISLIPLIGAIILLVFLCQDSQPGANKYGENPKQWLLWCFLFLISLHSFSYVAVSKMIRQIFVIGIKLLSNKNYNDREAWLWIMQILSTSLLMAKIGGKTISDMLYWLYNALTEYYSDG